MKSFGIVTRLAAAGLLACVFISTNSSAASTTWQDVRSTVATRGVATNGSLYVGAAANGIWTCKDLATWQQLSLPGGAGETYNDILWDGSQFIAVGDGVLTSPDGSTWTVASAPSSAEVWNAIAMKSGAYVVVGSDISHVLTSSDGQNWTLTATGLSASSYPGDTQPDTAFVFKGVATNGTGFVAVGYASPDFGLGFPYADIVAASADGSSWAAGTVPQIGGEVFDGSWMLSSEPFNNVAWGAGTYVAGGDRGVYTSPDGATWTAQAFPGGSNNLTIQLYTRIQFINGQFLAVGSDLVNKEYAVFTSSDGTSWKETPVAALGTSDYGLSWAVLAGSKYVVGGEGGTYSSPDLNTWTQTGNTPQPGIASCVAYDGSKFLTVGLGGSLASSDGTTWPGTVDTSVFGGDRVAQDCAAHGNGRIVVIGGIGGGGYEVSTDGNTWTAGNVGVETTFASTLQAIVWDGSKFISVAVETDSLPNQPQLASSTDGLTWSGITPKGLPAGITGFGLPNQLGGGLAYMNGYLVAWGLDANDVPFISLSSDGTTWSTSSVLSAGEDIAAVAYGNGEYLALGNDGSGGTITLTSSNGTSWGSRTTLSLGVNTRWDELIFGNDEFVATGVETDTGEGVIMNGDGSTTWDFVPQPDIGEIHDVAWDGASYVAVSQYDILEYTPPASNGGGGGSSGGTYGGGGGGSFDILALTLLSGFALGRRPRR